jgi:hypothetical protein
LGALQLLAEEATGELKQIRDKAGSRARVTGRPVRASLTTTNNVDYGFIVVDPSGTVNVDGVRGVDSDLVVKPFQWKGSFASVRAFVRDALENEIGMQPVETVGENNDLDRDGVADEFSVEQVTALTVYQAAQPRPATLIELNRRDPAAFPLTNAEKFSITAGEQLFSQTGCAGCHRPALRLKSSVFREPSRSPDYRDATFPSGANPVGAGLDPARPVSFDLTAHTDPSGLPFESDGRGGAMIRLFGDLKRHDMGPGLAESIDEKGTGASVWRTRELWGVGSTGPWLHDGRATTLREAILLHGGEAQESRDQFAALRQNDQSQVIKFLQNLVLFKAEPAEEAQVVRQQDRDRRH